MAVDPNIRKRMLEQGYAPDVIEWIEQEKEDQLRADFVKKNVILSTYYQVRSYYEFIADVFPGLEEFMVITGDSGFKKMDADELCEYQADKDNVYVVPASFINHYYSGATCKDLYALVVDVDRIKPETLDIIISNGNLGKNIPMPTYITNSGSGIHLYYVFDKKVPYYPKNRKILADMYRVLCGITKQRIAAKTDWHSIVQPFRLPGSLTKLGQVATAYECGSKWRVQDLAKRLGVDLEGLDLKERTLLSQEEYRKWKASRVEKGELPKPKRVFKLQDGNKGFYQSCLERCFEDTAEGHRYMSMVGLSVVAYKVGVEKERLEEDLERLLEHYNEIGSVVTKKEMQKAMRAYNIKALKCTSATLEEWFGWEFRRTYQERAKGRSRSEHLKRARLVQLADYPNGEWRNKEGAPTKVAQVKEWRAAHPDGRPKDCIADTGISKNTVYKWWNGEEAVKKKQTVKAKEDNVKIKFDTPTQETVATEIAARILQMSKEEQKKFWEMLKKAEENPENQEYQN